MKQMDAVKCAQAKWKQQVVASREQYIAALKKTAEHLKRNRTMQIDSFFKVQVMKTKGSNGYTWIHSVRLAPENCHLIVDGVMYNLLNSYLLLLSLQVLRVNEESQTVEERSVMLLKPLTMVYRLTLLILSILLLVLWAVMMIIWCIILKRASRQLFLLCVIICIYPLMICCQRCDNSSWIHEGSSSCYSVCSQILWIINGMERSSVFWFINIYQTQQCRKGYS